MVRVVIITVFNSRNSNNMTGNCVFTVFQAVLKIHCVCVCVCALLLSHISLFVTLWMVAHQAPLYMEFSRQEHWSRLPFPTPGNFSDPGIKRVSPAFTGGFFTTELHG